MDWLKEALTIAAFVVAFNSIVDGLAKLFGLTLPKAVIGGTAGICAITLVKYYILAS